MFKLPGRYHYKPRPLTPRNYRPRPKSGRRYKMRYTYPAPRPKRSVFKYVGVYKYEVRPSTPKNYCPRPKSSKRYECERSEDQAVFFNPYQKKSIFKPRVRYQYRSDQSNDQGVYKYQVLQVNHKTYPIINSL